MKPFPKLPNPHPDHAGRNFVERAANEAFARIAKRWQPSGEENETTHSTVSRYTQYLIDRLTGKAYSADELLSRPVTAADITAADITDASTSGKSVLTGTPAQGRAALEFVYLTQSQYNALYPNYDPTKVYVIKPSLSMDQEAIYYQSATSISAARALKVSEFLIGLTNLGLRPNFVDGATWREDSHLATGATLHSIRLLSNQTLTGGVTRSHNGIQYDGTSGWSKGSIPTLTGAKTLIVPNMGNSGDFATYSRIADLRDGSTLGASFRLGVTPGVAFVSSVNGLGGATSITVLAGAQQRNTWWVAAISEPSTGSAGGLVARNYPDGTSATGASVSQVALSKLVFGADMNAALTSAYGYTKRLIPGWLLFSKALSESETASVIALADKTLWPKSRWCFEGDSITNDTQAKLKNTGWFPGLNYDHVDLWQSGHTTTEAIAQLGTANGLRDNLASTDFPVFAWIGMGVVELAGGRSAADWWTDFQTLCAYAKARGMTVICPTITKSSSSTTGSAQEAQRLLANSYLRAAEGTVFDVLIDVDSAFVSLAGADYYSNTTYFRDGLHYTLGAGDAVAANLLEAEARILLP